MSKKDKGTKARTEAKKQKTISLQDLFFIQPSKEEIERQRKLEAIRKRNGNRSRIMSEIAKDPKGGQ